MKISKSIPKMIDNEMKIDMETEEIKTIGSSFQKTKIPRPRGWSDINFHRFLGLGDRWSTKIGKTLQSANSLGSIAARQIQ